MKKAITLTLGTGLFLFAGSALAQYGQPQQPPPQQGGQWGGSYGTSNMPTPTRSSSWSNIGDEGQLAIGVDRITGVSWDRVKTETDTTTTTSKDTTINLFGVSGGGRSGFIPRLALDYFPIESLSLGGSFLYSHTSGETETETTATTTTADNATTTTLGFAPRIGYAMAFDETFSLWPRAGITYINAKTETSGINPATGATVTSEDTFSGVELSIEALVGISPFENFAIGIGPYLDLPLSGTVESCPDTGACTETDTSLTSFGLTTSIIAYWSP